MNSFHEMIYKKYISFIHVTLKKVHYLPESLTFGVSNFISTRFS